MHPGFGLAVFAVLVGCTAEFDPALLDRGRPPSCEGLAALCGGDRNCCESASIAGGTYDRSYDRSDAPGLVAGWQPAGAAPATVRGFRLDTFEVTVGRFRRFVAAYDAWRAAGNPAPGAGAHRALGVPSGWQGPFDAFLPAGASSLRAALGCGPDATWTDVPGGEMVPINCVTWYEASAFCIWDGGRLPTEVEWNYAAAGGDEQRAFPWSSPPGDLTIDDRHAVFSGAATNVANVGSRAPLGASRFGPLDLAGNVREWVLDYYGDLSDGYDEPSVAPPCVDCADLTAGTQRVRRGGAYDTGADHLRSAYRSESPPLDRLDSLGVRCARDQ